MSFPRIFTRSHRFEGVSKCIVICVITKGCLFYEKKKKSFMQKLQRIGPSTEPCGTLDITS